MLFLLSQFMIQTEFHKFILAALLAIPMVYTVPLVYRRALKLSAYLQSGSHVGYLSKTQLTALHL
jgi:hypothetical protein